MTYTYQWFLVAFSVFIAIFVSYTTLRLALRLAWASRQTLPFWIAGGACAMGIGIWAMHFVGMLALHLPVPLAYDAAITAVSVLPAILASAIALYVLSRPGSSGITRFIASVLMGLGIVAMHYSGMAAMQMSPPIVYDITLLALSVLIAVGASWVALFLVFQERSNVDMTLGRRLVSAVVMGLAIAGMHYTGMAAAQFAPDAVCTVAATGLGGNAIGLFVGLVAVLVLAASVALTFYDEVVGENDFHKALLAAQSDAGEGVLLIESGRVIYANRAMEILSGYSEDELKTLWVWMDLVGSSGAELLKAGSTGSGVLHPSSGRREIMLKMRDGQRRPCEVVVTSFRHAETTRHLLVCIDISVRKAAEEALRASDAQARELALVASHTDNAVIITDAQGLITWVNEGFEKIAGYTLAEVQGVKPGELLQGADSDPAVRHMMREQLAHGEGFKVEIVNYHKSGRKYWVAIDVKPIRDEHGELVKFIAIERDITDRKLADEILRLSEMRLKEAQYLARLGSWEFDLVSDEYILSDEALRIHELTSLTGRVPRAAVAALIHPEDAEALRQCRAEALATLGTLSVQLRLVFPDGHLKYVYLRGAVQGDELGKPIRVSGSIQDITEQQLAEAALRQSEARLKEAQQLARFGNWELSLQSDEYMMSEEALRIHEMTSPTGRVPQAAVMALIFPDDRDHIRQARTQALVTRGSYAVEFRLNFPHGRLKYLQLRAAVHADQQGKPVRISGSIQDISEQKLAQQALVRLNETLEARVRERTQELDQQRTFIETILNSAETLIFVIDHRGRFVRFNGALERLTGFLFEELENRPLWESVIPPERRAEVRAKHENVSSPDTLTRSLEVEWLTRPGQRRLISWSNAVLTDEAGRLKFMIGTGIDITDRKHAENALIEANQNLNQSIASLRETQTQLVQAEKMASLGGLVAGISHEINTPLGIGVTSATALQEELLALRRDFEGGTMKRSTLERFISYGTSGCDILVSNLMRAADLIRSFKQVAVDQSSDEWRQLNLHDYIDEIILSLKPKLKGGKIQVLNTSTPNLMVHSHPGAIYQILSNLLINALAHGYEPDQSGVIRITAEPIGDEIQIDFSDDGKGIPAAIQGRIFDPFFTTRRGTGGSGLGLHIVFNLVVSTLSGVIYLVKDVARGATFRIRFPMNPEKDTP